MICEMELARVGSEIKMRIYFSMEVFLFCINYITSYDKNLTS